MRYPRYKDSSRRSSIQCPFCYEELDDDGGCHHVVYTFTNADGFKYKSYLVEKLEELLGRKLAEKERRELIALGELNPGDLNVDEMDIEFDEFDFQEKLGRRIGRFAANPYTLVISSVWGGTAKYVVGQSVHVESARW